jgi:hypothetical protein
MPDTLVDRIKLGWRLFICSTDAAGIINWGTQGLEKYKNIAEGVQCQEKKILNEH